MFASEIAVLVDSVTLEILNSQVRAGEEGLVDRCWRLWFTNLLRLFPAVVLLLDNLVLVGGLGDLDLADAAFLGAIATWSATLSGYT